MLMKYACGGEPVFVYGSNDDRQFKDHAKDGAVLWVLTTKPGYPPTLVARLNGIERVEDGVARSAM